MIALVTGATGFVGSQLCKGLIENGFAVRAFHRERSTTRALNGVTASRIMGDILDCDSLRRAMRDVDLVFHVAARADYWRTDHPQLKRVIIEGTHNVLKIGRELNIKRVIYTSSLAALGVPPKGELLTETHRFNETEKRWGYGFAKHCAEQEVLQAVEDGLDCVIVNPSAVMGAGDLNQIGGALIVEMARRRLAVTPSGGMNVVHIADVVRGQIAAATDGKVGERYIIGGENIWHRDLFRLIAQEIGTTPPRVVLPSALVNFVANITDAFSFLPLPINGSALRQSTQQFFCDSSKAQHDLNLPAPLSAQQAVREAVTWYRSQKVF